MATALDRGTRFTRQANARGRNPADTTTQTQRVNLAGPWGGYTPDLTDDLVSPAYASDSMDIIERNGDLVSTPGFERVGSSTLPLGDTSPPAASTDAAPVLGLFQAAKRTGSGGVYRLAVTGLDPSGGTVGYLYEFDGTNWNRRAPKVTDHAGDLTSSVANLIEFAYVPWSAADSYSGGAGQVIFCNGRSGDAVYGYPNNSNEYFAMPFTNISTVTNANSLAHFNTRICLFNTIEDSTIRPHRFRWFAPAQLDGTAAGAGYVDVDDVEGVGLKSLPIADSCALYFGRGVAFVSRSGSSSAPFRIDYVTRQRGLLGKKAACSIGAGAHFGIYTDGWLVLDASGQFTELGVLSGNGRAIRKWSNTFYDSLSVGYSDRTIVAYDSDNHLIHIAYVSKDSTTGLHDRAFIYDMTNDTLWPVNYGSHFPTAFGEYDSSLADTTWNGSSGTWNDQTRSWDVNTAAGRYQLIHGTYGGLVFKHSRAINTKDGQAFTSYYRSKKAKGESFDAFNIFDRLAVEYKRVSEDDAVMDLSMYVDESSSTRSITLSKGATQSNQVDFMTGRLSGQRFGWGISGVAPLQVKGVQMDIFIEADYVQKRGS